MVSYIDVKVEGFSPAMDIPKNKIPWNSNYFLFEWREEYLKPIIKFRKMRYVKSGNQ